MPTVKSPGANESEIATVISINQHSNIKKSQQHPNVSALLMKKQRNYLQTSPYLYFTDNTKQQTCTVQKILNQNFVIRTL